MSRLPGAGHGSPPRGGDLLTLLAADLPGCELRRGRDVTSLVLVEAQPRFLLEVQVERRRLLTLQTSIASVVGPATDVDAATRLVLHHRGQLRRTGLKAKVDGGDDVEVRGVRDRLLADDELRDASLDLDFTSFVVAPVDGHWRARLELMGGSHVRTTLPPSSRYVGLPTEQLRALVATIAVLRRRLPADDAALGRVAAAAGVTFDPGTAGDVDDRDLASRPDRRDGVPHLPRRSDP